MKSEDYQFVDLVFSVKWATCNVGANTPEEYGDRLLFANGKVLLQGYNRYSGFSVRLVCE